MADDDKPTEEDEETEVEVDGEGPGTRSSSEDSTKEYCERSVTGQEMEPDTSDVSLVSDEKDKGHIKGHTKRKRLNKANQIEKVMDNVVTKIRKDHEESEKRFAEVELKRIKLEEKLIEMEEQRQREERQREEQQRREERDFQLKMMAMVYGGQNQYMQSSTPPQGSFYYPHSFPAAGISSNIDDTEC